jgi:type IV secretory pathway VirB4 component
MEACFQATTGNLAALYPFMAEAGLGGRGVLIGQALYGGPFCYDPWELYRRRAITSPNLLVIGQLGSGKSALVKSYGARQLVFGRKLVYLDPKGETWPLAGACGTEPIRLEPGGRVRLNPLDRRIAGPHRGSERVRREQLEVLGALVGSALRRELEPVERAALEVALAAATEAAEARGQEPTLNRVAQALLHPSPRAAEALVLGVAEAREAGRAMGYELERLCSGDLAGMFDGESTVALDLEAPLVSLDLSAVWSSDGLRLVMVCAGAWLQRSFWAGGGRRILVLDEAWRVLSDLATARWLAATVKLARALGVQVVAVLHRLSDLAAAGAADSEQVQLARGLLADTDTQVVYRQSRSEVERAGELLQLGEAERELIPELPVGCALWRVGRSRFVVRHQLSELEARVVDTDQRMR